MKQFECRTLVPGCAWQTQADDAAEVVRRAADHLRTVHGEEAVRPEMIDHIKARVHESTARRA